MFGVLSGMPVQAGESEEKLTSSIVMKLLVA
jgi:hypothetical protein